jgi:hypothetical protein
MHSVDITVVVLDIFKMLFNICIADSVSSRYVTFCLKMQVLVAVSLIVLQGFEILINTNKFSL